jgi:hypothetical protein
MLLSYWADFTVSGIAMLSILHVGCLILFITTTVHLCHLYRRNWQYPLANIANGYNMKI